MNAKTAKLCRKAALVMQVPSRLVKSRWKKTPRPERHEMRGQLVEVLKHAK